MAKSNPLYSWLPLFLILALALLNGCNAALPISSRISAEPPGPEQGLLSLFLRLNQKQCPPCGLTILKMEIMTDSGQWIPLGQQPRKVDSSLGDRQIFLHRQPLPTGSYTRLRLSTRTEQVSPLPSTSDGNRLARDTHRSELFLDSPLYIGRGDSRSLFLVWDVTKTMAQNGTPALDVDPKLTHLVADIAYVTCPAIDTLYMISTGKNRVIDSMGVRGAPSFLTVGPAYTGADTLLVLKPKKLQIARILPSTTRTIETVNLSMMSNPEHLALSADGQTAFVLDRERGNVFRINLRSGQTEDRIHLGFRPSYLLTLPKKNLLAVTLSLSQSVVLLRQDDLKPIQTITTGSQPQGLLSWEDRLLYVAEAGAGTLLIYDLETGSSRRVTVDFSPRRLASARGRIFVANQDSRTLSMLLPGRLTSSRTIRLQGRPGEMADIPRNSWLYVTDEDNDSITVINPLTGQISGEIALGCQPLGLVAAH